jgi:predicted transcriptional regulator
MTNKKITKRDRFNALLSIPAVQADPDMVAFIEHELELLAKKNSADKKPTAQQVANDGIKQAILEAMEDNRLYTITEIQKSVDECAELSNQRVSALMRQLKDAGLVARTEDKRKAYFSKA